MEEIPVTESRIDATHRLQREGRLDEATEYRRQVRKDQQAAGKTKAEAGEIAWEKMGEKYPPLPPEPEAEPEGLAGDQLDELLQRTEGQSVDLIADTLWVYENLANQGAGPEDSPSVGSWGLLQWARKYNNQFFDKMLPKALTAKEKIDHSPESEAQRGEDLRIDELVRRAKTIAEGTKVFYCQECWGVLGPGMEYVEVTRLKVPEKGDDGRRVPVL